MTDRIDFSPNIRKTELCRALLYRKSCREQSKRILLQHFGRPVVLLNSGRTGIYLALAAQGMTRVDEILVPRYMGQCVLNAINRTAFPTTTESARVKAILLLHQFGYPQHIEEVINYAQTKGWLVIENCAHSIASTYRGRNIGLFGDAAICSFPKVFPTILGGCLITESERILSFAQAYLGSKRGLCRTLLSNISVVTKFPGIWPKKMRESHTSLLEMCYSQFVNFPSLNTYVSHLLLQSLMQLASSIQQRKRNLAIFREYFLGNGYWHELEEDCEVIPYVAPYLHKDGGRLVRVVETLKRMNIETEILHFDIRRNMLYPDYRKCVPIPVHQGISDNSMHHICQNIAEAVK